MLLTFLNDQNAIFILRHSTTKLYLQIKRFASFDTFWLSHYRNRKRLSLNYDKEHSLKWPFQGLVTLRCGATNFILLNNKKKIEVIHGLEPYLPPLGVLTTYTIDTFFRLYMPSVQYATWTLVWYTYIVQNTEQSLRICVFYTWICFVERVGFEPTTWSLQSYRSSQTELTPHLESEP